MQNSRLPNDTAWTDTTLIHLADKTFSHQSCQERRSQTHYFLSVVHLLSGLQRLLCWIKNKAEMSNTKDTQTKLH